MKTCNICQTFLPVSEFYRDSHYRDNLKASCKKCLNARSMTWAAANRERSLANKRAWGQANPLKVAASNRKHRSANPDKLRAAYADWVARNPEKKEAGRKRWKDRNRDTYLAACSRAGRAWREANPEKVTAKTARRRAQLRMAAVDWADKKAVLAFYREARRLTKEKGVPYQVDHIIPLQSRIVCGLHNEFNLRVVTATENKQKHNKFSPQRQPRLIA